MSCAFHMKCVPKFTITPLMHAPPLWPYRIWLINHQIFRASYQTHIQLYTYIFYTNASY